MMPRMMTSGIPYDDSELDLSGLLLRLLLHELEHSKLSKNVADFAGVLPPATSA